MADANHKQIINLRLVAMNPEVFSEFFDCAEYRLKNVFGPEFEKTKKLDFFSILDDLRIINWGVREFQFDIVKPKLERLVEYKAGVADLLANYFAQGAIKLYDEKQTKSIKFAVQELLYRITN